MQKYEIIWVDCLYYGFYMELARLRQFQLHGQQLSEIHPCRSESSELISTPIRTPSLTRRKTYKKNIEEECFKSVTQVDELHEPVAALEE